MNSKKTREKGASLEWQLLKQSFSTNPNMFEVVKTVLASVIWEVRLKQMVEKMAGPNFGGGLSLMNAAVVLEIHVERQDRFLG